MNVGTHRWFTWCCDICQDKIDMNIFLHLVSFFIIPKRFPMLISLLTSDLNVKLGITRTFTILTLYIFILLQQLIQFQTFSTTFILFSICCLSIKYDYGAKATKKQKIMSITDWYIYIPPMTFMLFFLWFQTLKTTNFFYGFIFCMLFSCCSIQD